MYICIYVLVNNVAKLNFLNDNSLLTYKYNKKANI